MNNFDGDVDKTNLLNCSLSEFIWCKAVKEGKLLFIGISLNLCAVEF